MIYATDFDELVFSCSDLLRYDPRRLVLELVETIEKDSHYAAATTFAILHASFDMCLPQDHVGKLFSLAEGACSKKNMAKCVELLGELEKSYYSNYMDEYQGKPVFSPPPILQ